MARPRWGQVRQFCKIQGYVERLSDHYYYDKVLPDGSRSGTKVSLGKDGDEVRSGRWHEVWRHQLRLANEDEFWKGLAGEAIAYDVPPTPEAATPLPDYLARHLRNVLHYSEEQIAATPRAEAQALINAYHSHDLSQPLDDL